MMRYRVTITTTPEMLPTVIQVLTDSRVSDFRVEPTDERPAPTSASKMNGRARTHLPKIKVNTDTPVRQYILAAVKAEPGISSNDLRVKSDQEGAFPVGTISSTITWLAAHGVLKRERKTGETFRYWLA